MKKHLKQTIAGEMGGIQKKTRVLIFPAGEINSVELHDALSHNVNVEVFGASSVERHGKHAFKNYRGGLPKITEESFVPSFNGLLDEWGIDYVFPTHDTVALYMAQHRGQIKAGVIAGSYETAATCRDKKKMYELFGDCEFCPRQYAGMTEMPVFIKPRFGQGGQGAKLIRTADDMPNGIDLNDYTVSEYLPGRELTVDCLTDAGGTLCACLPRTRERLLAGICVAGESVAASDEIMGIAMEINRRLEFLGLWYFQLRESKEGRYKLLEISTRCAGAMCLSRARGVNLPLLSVYAAMGKAISVFENPFRVRMDRTLVSRYDIDYPYETVYVDYDDTVVERERVCLPVIRFLYQCRNLGKRVVLLTRHEAHHEDGIFHSLDAHAISRGLFDEIVTLTRGQKKAEFIKSQDAIFIDNAYAERKEVHDVAGIPVFDVEGIEAVTDWRS